MHPRFRPPIALALSQQRHSHLLTPTNAPQSRGCGSTRGLTCRTQVFAQDELGQDGQVWDLANETLGLSCPRPAKSSRLPPRRIALALAGVTSGEVRSRPQ